MNGCDAIKRDGTRCGNTVRFAEEGKCFAHGAKSIEGRAKGRFTRGKFSSLLRSMPPDLAGMKARLIKAFDEVEAGTLPARQAEVMGQLAGRILDIDRFALELGRAQTLQTKLDRLEGDLREITG